jgi:hypothetical protein
MFGQTWEEGLTFGFAIALVLALWAIFHIVQSDRSPIAKAIWSVVVLLLPYLGFLAWLIFGPRQVRGRR